ncbi:MAG: hypothetical protein R6X20_06830 [Phycisphaerae bacterium]
MAADLTQTFMGKHGEKVAVGVAGLIFVGAAAWFVVMREPHGELLDETKTLVSRLDAKVRQEVELEEVLQPEERTQLGIGRKGTTVADLKEAVTGLPPDYQVALTMVSPLYKPKKEIKGPEQHFAPKDKILPVEEVQVAVGYGVTDALDVPNPLASLQTAEATYHDIVWAGVVGKLDLTKQVQIIQGPYLEEGRTAPLSRQSPITITRVEIQRRQIKPDGTMTDWENVTPAVPPAATAELPTAPADNKDRAMVGKWYQGLVQNQAQMRRLPFYNILSLGAGQTPQSLAGEVTGVRQPDLSRFATEPAPAPTGEQAAAATGGGATPAPAETKQPATGGGSVFERILTPKERPSEQPTETAEGPEREHVFATLWASDANVDPGNTYQYRMRAAILNPVWSLPSVQPAEARWTLEFLGPWSDPADPVSIPELSEFYFVGTFGERINLELHKWLHGQWIIVPSAPTYIGAPVVYVKSRARITVPGSGETVEKDVEIAPGVFLVDIVRQFPYQPKGGTRPINTNVLMYADEQGNLLRRIDWEDQERSRNDRKERKQAAPAPAGGRRRRR